ncbi:Leucine carboxyl methyltransferase [Fodinibius salinus]|uniref:Leucine carboxyl methyltransferase n=1 Tax=Fodinibius salinus TaxID=860790 RepID=A0A5D3YNX0_9BACT|nr:class I SAM-dependent methyltransferase [Fodinibius salinus]TYP95392.1 Leucine carboxyl methyltransferase [Fodinibius salinus]
MKADQLSQTATFIAIKFYGLTRIDDFQTLFDASTIKFYDKLVTSLPAPLSYYHYWLQLGWIRKLYIWSEELLLPGDLLHIMGRKWIIGHILENLVDEGYEQIIVLGAGFDHLSHKYMQQDVSCIELDTPHMAELKRRFLDEYYPNSRRPRILDVHLPNDNIDTIFSNEQQINPHKKTIIVAEGFFDYLSSETVSLLLQQIGNYFTAPPKLVGTHFALDELSAFRRTVFTRSVQIVGEKLSFNTSVTEFRQLLQDNNYQIQLMQGAKDIRQRIVQHVDTDLPILPGFYIFKAQKK